MSCPLAPLPPPGLPLTPFIAQTPQSFLLKGQDLWSNKASFLIYHSTPAGEMGSPYLKLYEEKRDNIVIRTLEGSGENGQEVMRIVREAHKWSGRGAEYRAVAPNGGEIWYLKLHRGLRGTEYQITVPNHPTISIQNKIQGADKAILLNSLSPSSSHPPAIGATMSRFEEWKHMSRHDLVHVAAGMDVLLALSVAWIRADKQKQDAKIAAAAT